MKFTGMKINFQKWPAKCLMVDLKYICETIDQKWPMADLFSPLIHNVINVN